MAFPKTEPVYLRPTRKALVASFCVTVLFGVVGAEMVSGGAGAGYVVLGLAGVGPSHSSSRRSRTGRASGWMRKASW